PSAAPRVYEQQIIMNKDVIDSLKGDRTKTFHNIQQFTDAMKLLEEDSIQDVTLSPGDVIGKDAEGKLVHWEKSKDAKFTIQGGKAVAEWQEDLFKLQVGGEKGTVNPFSQRVMEAITGSKEVVAIMNPNVEKHLDLGMLYESKAGLFSQKARQLLAQGETAALAKLN